MDGGLAVLAGMDMASVTPGEDRWAFSEWKQVAGRRFCDRGPLLYNQDTGGAAVLVPRANGLLEVAAALGMRWKPGKALSRRSLRGLRPLARTSSSSWPRRGASWRGKPSHRRSHAGGVSFPGPRLPAGDRLHMIGQALSRDR